MLVEKSVSEFLKQLGSADAVPGGGAASAVAAALAANLFNMVIGITLEKEPDKAAGLTTTQHQMQTLAAEVEALIDRDAQAYQRVKDAYRMPKDAEDKRIARSMEIQLAMREAAEVPLELAERTMQMLEAAHRIAEVGRTSCISDAGVGNFMALSAIMGALLNVEINLQAIDDDGFTTRLSARLAELQERSRAQFEQINDVVMARLQRQNA
jgi:formiminotetrahydrofolate cyclodeaminase